MLENPHTFLVKTGSQKAMMYDMLNSLNSMEAQSNDLKAFKKYIEEERADADSSSGLYDAVNSVQYTYDMDMNVYTKSVDGTVIRSDSRALMQDLLMEYFGMNISSMLDMQDFMGFGMDSSLASMSPMGSQMILWQEMLPDDNGKLINPLLEKQYDLVYGSWPNSYDEIVLVVDENNEIDDMTLYALGLKSKEDIDELAKAAFDKTTIDVPELKWSYEDICNMEFRTVLSADCYTLDEKTGTYTDLRETQAGLKYLYDNGIPLKVSGIIRPADDAVSTMLSGSIAYTSKLTEYVIDHSHNAAAVTAQLDDPKTDIFTSLPFRENTGDMTDGEKAAEFRNYVSALDESGKASAYVKIMSVPDDDEIEMMVSQSMGTMTREDMEAAMSQAMTAQMGMSESTVSDYISAMSDDDITELFTQSVTEQIKAQYAENAASQLSAMSNAQLAAAFDAAVSAYSEEQEAKY